MNTIDQDAASGRRKRRRYTDEFKAEVVAACRGPSVSVAAIALMHKLNANLLRRWLEKAESGATTTGSDVVAMKPSEAAPILPAFVPLQLSDANGHQREIRVEVRRSQQSITVSWPISDAASAQRGLNQTVMANQLTADYLLQPTGKYGVSFEDLHWINDAMCPDPNYSKERRKDFTADNRKFCHEVMVRAYCQISIKTNSGAPYYRPIITAEQIALRAVPGINPEDIEALLQLKSHAIRNAPIAKNCQFPVVLFISGLGGRRNCMKI